MVGIPTASAPVPPASGTDSARPSRRGRAPFPTQQSPVVRGVTRPGPALDEKASEDGSDVREMNGAWDTGEWVDPLF